MARATSLPRDPVLVFDLWDTLVYNDQRPRPFDELVMGFGLDPSDPAARVQVEVPFSTQRFTGIHEALDHLEQVLSRPFAGRAAFERRWEEADRTAQLYDDALPALDALTARFRTALLSNTQSFGLERIQALGVFDRFELKVLSCEHGLAKPDPAFFAIPARELGVPAERLVMIGDSTSRDTGPARAAGYGGTILIDRAPEKHGARPRTETVVRDLREIPALLDFA